MELFNLIRCPVDNSRVSYDGEFQKIRCQTCGIEYQCEDGIPVLFDENKAAEIDVQQKHFYEEVYLKKSSGSEQIEAIVDQNKETFINKFWRETRDFYATSRSVNEIFDCFRSQFSFRGGETVLEIGCGTGTPGTQECINNKDKITYLGVDFALKQLHLVKKDFAKNGAKHFELINADVLSEALAQESFDVIFGRGILHHFDSEAKILLGQRIYSLLKPGGKAFFLEPLNTNPVMKLLRFLTKPARPNLVWEHPFSGVELKGFSSCFDSHQHYYFEALSMLSLGLAFQKNLFDVANRSLRVIDKILAGFPLYKSFFTKAVIVTYKAK